MDDDAEIRALISAHFEPMRWSATTAPDWKRFREDFLPDALLFGAARPVLARSVDGFVDRMETVARASLQSFEEHTRGMIVHRYGNVAVVLAGSELIENGTERSYDVSAYLLVKSDGRWAIAAQAWDQAGDGSDVPDALRTRPSFNEG